MAKKKQSSKVNKSAEIRSYLESHPNEKPSSVASALKNKGVDVDAQYVSVVKSATKTKSRAGKKVKPKTSSRAVRSDLVSIDAIVKAKQFVMDAGGIDEARKALSAIEKLVD